MEREPRRPGGGECAPGGAGLAETVYAQLRAIAASQMRGERAAHTLSATALVHEAYMRMGDGAGAGEGRGLFLHHAAEAMRRILIEHARARARLKRGGGAVRVSLETIGDVADLGSVASGEGSEAVLEFDRAFGKLAEHDGRVAEVVRLRFFGGLSVPEVAAALGVSARTVDNRWAYARAWLARELQGGA